MSWRRSVFCLAVIVLVAVIVYQPALRMGFWTDDYAFLEFGCSLTFCRLLALQSLLKPAMALVSTDAGVMWWIAFNRFTPMRPVIMRFNSHCIWQLPHCCSTWSRTFRAAGEWDLSPRWSTLHCRPTRWQCFGLGSPIHWSACFICSRLHFVALSRIGSRTLVCIGAYRICRRIVSRNRCDVAHCAFSCPPACCSPADRFPRFDQTLFYFCDCVARIRRTGIHRAHARCVHNLAGLRRRRSHFLRDVQPPCDTRIPLGLTYTA